MLGIGMHHVARKAETLVSADEVFIWVLCDAIAGYFATIVTAVLIYDSGVLQICLGVSLLLMFLFFQSMHA